MIYLKLVILLCSVIGAIISLYFMLATYRMIPNDLIGTLPVCNVNGTEKRIVDTRFGKILYIPNSIYGLAYYLVLLVLTIGWWSQWPSQLLFLVSVISGGVVLFSIILYFALTKKLHTHCRLCITAHLINTILFLTFILRTILFNQTPD